MKNNQNLGLALVTGAAIGGIISILYAPQSGRETRREIADRASRTADALSRAAEDLKGSVKNAYLDEKATFETRISAILSDTNYKADELITLLESKLKELKKKNQTLNKRKTKAKTS